MFHVDPNRGRIFLPEHVVLSKEEYRQQKREEQSSEAKEAKNLEEGESLSLDEEKRLSTAATDKGEGFTIQELRTTK